MLQFEDREMTDGNPNVTTHSRPYHCM